MAGKRSKKRQVHLKTPLSSSKLASPPSSCDPQDSISPSVDEGASASEVVAPSPRSAKACRHVERGVNVDLISSKLSKSKFSLFQCKECVSDSKGSKKKKGKAGRKVMAAASGSSELHDERWICLACGQVLCSSISSHKSKQSNDQEEENAVDSRKKAPTGHIWKHSLMVKHPLALQVSNALVCWCFMCNMSIEYSFPAAALPCEDGGSLNLTAVTRDTSLPEAVQFVYRKLIKDAGLLKDKEFKELAPKDDMRNGEYISQVDSLDSLRSSSAASVRYIVSQRMRLVRGMMNLGNTCFFNSVMQNLLALDMLRNHFTECPLEFDAPITSSLRRLYLETNPDNSNPGTAVQASGYESGLRKGLRCMNVSENSAICNPRSLFGAVCAKAPRFKGFQEQDSHELLRCLLEGLNAEERNARTNMIPKSGYKGTAITSETMVMNDICISEFQDSKKEHVDSVNLSVRTDSTTFVESCFGGQLCSTVRCKSCGHSSIVYEPMLDLSLQIPIYRPKLKGVIPKTTTLSGSGARLRRGSVQREMKCSKSVQRKESEEAFQCESVEENKCLVPSNDSTNLLKMNASANHSDDSEFGWLDYVEDFISGGLQSAEVSLQGCDDPSLSSKQNNQNDSNDLVAGNDLVVVTPPKFDKNDNDSTNLLKMNVSANHSDDSEFGRLDYVEDFISGGLQSAEVSLQGCDDPLLSSKQNNQNDSNDLVSGNDLAVVTPLKFDKNDNVCADKIKNVDIPPCVVPSDEISTLQDKPPGEEEQLPIASGILLLPYEPLNVSGYSSEITTFEMEQDKDDFDGFSQLFEEEESILAGNQSIEASGVHSERTYSANESVIDDDTWETHTTIFDEDDSIVTPSSGECEDYFPPMSLEGCLADFTKTELLCGENAWECENCTRLLKEKTQSLRTNDDLSSEDMGGRFSESPAVNSFKMSSNGGKCLETDFGSDRKISIGVPDFSSVHSIEDGADSAISSAGDQEGEEVRNGRVKGNNFNNGNKELVKQMKTETKTLESHKKTAEKSFEMANTDENRASCNIDMGIQGNSSVNNGLDIGNAIVGDTLMEDDSSQISRSTGDCLEARLQLDVKGKSFTMKAGERARFKSQLQGEKLVKRDATKRLLISKAPPVLTVHLKRFAQDIRGRLNKLNGHVSFPEFLDLRPFLDPRCLDSDHCVYRLVGLVEHTGSMRGGHYIAYVRGPCAQDAINDKNGDLWYYISDSNVRKATLQAVLKSEAYLLFYEKCKTMGS